MRRLWWAMVLGCVWVTSAAALQTLYVDNTNPCPGLGSTGDPYCSIQRALDVAVLDTHIHIRTGTGIYDQYATTSARHGTSTARITIQPDTGATFVLRNCNAGAAEAALEILDSDYWTIQGLTFDGSGCGTAPSRYALKLQGVTRDITGVQVLNNTFTDWRQTVGEANGPQALYLAGCDTALGCAGNFHAIGATVQGNTFTNVDCTGIGLIRTQGTLIDSNTIQAMRCGRDGTTSLNDAVFTIPSRTYGIANEPCASPSGTDITVSTASALNTEAENAANVGKNIFLNAGTYTLTSDLDLVNGVTLRPNNCATVMISGRVRPCNSNTISGLMLDRQIPGGASQQGAVDFSRGICAGSIVRNNLIQAVGMSNVSVLSGDVTATIEGNDIVTLPDATASRNQIRISAANMNVIIERNQLRQSGAGGLEDTIGPSTGNLWGGTVTVRNNYFVGNDNEDFMDIKGAAALGSVINIVGNYFNGDAAIGGCILLQHFGPGGTGTYTANVEGNYFDRCSKALITHISTGETGSLDQVSLNFNHNIVVTKSTASNSLELNRNGGANIVSNAIISPVAGIGEFEIGTTGNTDPSGIVVQDNIFYQSLFDGSSAIDTCEYNTFFSTTGTPTCTNTLTSDPLFVNPASNWHLQSSSPARNSSSTGLDRGAYPVWDTRTVGIHYTHSNTGLTIRGNTIQNFTSYLSCPLTSQGVATVAGIWCDTGGGTDSGNVIESNVIHDLDDGKADLANASGVSHSASGIFLEEQCAGTLVKNNVLYDIGTYGMRNEYHATGGTSHAPNAYYHNSLYDMLEPLYFKEGVALVKNNLVSVCRGVCIKNDDDADNTLTIDGNLYHDGGTQTKIGQISPGSPLVFTSWQSACGCDAASINADPQLAVTP